MPNQFIRRAKLFKEDINFRNIIELQCLAVCHKHIYLGSAFLKV